MSPRILSTEMLQGLKNTLTRKYTGTLSQNSFVFIGVFILDKSCCISDSIPCVVKKLVDQSLTLSLTLPLPVDKLYTFVKVTEILQ